MRERLLPLAIVGAVSWIMYGCSDGTGMGTGVGGDTGTAGSVGAGGGGGTTGAAGSGSSAGSGGNAGGSGSAAAGRGGSTGAAGGMTGTAGAAGRGGTAGGATGGAAAVPSCTWPTPASTVMLSATQTISGTYDGGMRRFVGTGPLGSSGQNEDQGALFNVASGGTLQNVILGNPAADGIHCEGTCTLKNVWWEDVGEDAATLQGSSASQVMTIDGGGARAASDKVFQHNGPGTMIIRNFCAQDFGKLYRSCGNCDMQYTRNVQVQNVIVVPGSGTSSLVGVNANYNDTATFSAITIRARANSVTICTRYNGNDTGAEPTSAGSGADGTVCKYSASDITWMP
jgi:hypothetical protein